METINRIETWFQEHLPEVLADLNPGATQNEIELLETSIGVPLPSSFKEFYRWHNGQKREILTGLFYGLEWLSLEEVYKEWKNWSALFDEGFAEARGESFHPEKVKEVYLNRLWILFTDDGGGNHLGIALDPGSKGTVGQIINFGPNENTKYVLADNFQSFLSWFIIQLESGNYIVYEDSEYGKVFQIKNPNMKHFLDAVSVMFKKHL